MSKIESTLDQLVSKLGQLKNVGKSRLCALWQKASPHTSKLKQLDWVTLKAFVTKYKWRILLALIVLYAGSKTYDYFFPQKDKAGGPITVTTMVVQKRICR